MSRSLEVKVQRNLQNQVKTFYLATAADRSDLMRKKRKLNSTSSRKTKNMQANIHISKQVTYDTLGTDLIQLKY